ncbi:unnamed protein product [Ostreobium quekettii]|uniref:BRCT domain-containing protein n=1 Tax=Ostreobium quekettii TaxID=121088 RepID=A0A8S1J1F3_9CHLO|nr:unnamed protein product [Ostreobium quekettii]
MDQPSAAPQIFKGFVFYIDLDGGGNWGKDRDLTSVLTVWIRTSGGRVCRLLDQGCTHVVARHSQQDVCRWASARGIRLASPLWVYHCITKKELLPIVEKPFRGPMIPGFTNHVNEITISEFKNHERVIVRYLCECTGAAYSGQLTVPTQTSHLIANNVASNSQKIQSAKRCSTVKIVPKTWLDDCLTQWRHVPEGPYTEATTSPVSESSEENGNLLPSAEMPSLTVPPRTKETGQFVETEVVGKSFQLYAVDEVAEGGSANSLQDCASHGKGEGSTLEQNGDVARQDVFLEACEHATGKEGNQAGSCRGKVGQGASEGLSFTYNEIYEGLDMSQQVGLASAVVSRLACQLAPPTPNPELPETEVLRPPGDDAEVPHVDSAGQSADRKPEVDKVCCKCEAINRVETASDGHDGEQNTRQELNANLEQNGVQEAKPLRMTRQRLRTPRDARAKVQSELQSKKARPQNSGKKMNQSPGKKPVKRRHAGGIEAVVRTSKRSRTSDPLTGSDKEEQAVVALSGVRTSQRLRYIGVLSGLHVRCASGSYDLKHQWNDQITHVVLPELKRNEKAVCGMAAGKWLVSTDYVEACAKQQRLLDPSAYELQNGEKDVISKG